MELKFKEVDDTYAESEIVGLKIRSYLKINEINEIVNLMLETDSPVERYMIKVCKATEFCTNIDLSDFISDGNEANGEDIFNFVVEVSDLYDANIYNYYMIDKLIKDTESPYNLLKSFVTVVNDKISDFNILDIKNQIESLKDIK